MFSSNNLVVELDVSYQSWSASGITTYTVALAEELSAHPSVELILCHRGETVPVGYPQATTHRLTVRDALRVRRGRLRLVPHQLRVPVLRGDLVITIHDLIYAGPWSPWRKRVAFAALLAAFRRRRVGVLADSHGTRSRLLSAGFDPKLISVCQPQLPQSVRARPPLSPPSCGGGGAAYLGNLRPHKDVGTLVRAHASLPHGGALHLVTSGDLEEVDRLRGLYPVEARSRLCLHHRISDLERDAVLQHALVVISPSLEEGYGYAIDEGLAQGTPVIASFIPPHVELADGRDVDLFAPGDVDELRGLLAVRLAGDGRASEGKSSPLRHRTDLVTVLEGLVAAQQ